MRSVGYKGMLNEDDESFNNLQNNGEKKRDEAESKGGGRAMKKWEEILYFT